MGYDYRQKLKAEGQQHSNACWAASISWWTAAMSLHFKRKMVTQIELLADFQDNVMLGGGVHTGGLRKIAESARIRLDLKYILPQDLKDNYSIASPCIIIYNYPEAGGTHMNVIFDRQGDTVMCMEPFYPLQADKYGVRKGAYIRRSLSFFKGNPQIGFGCLPLNDAVYGVPTT